MSERSAADAAFLSNPRTWREFRKARRRLRFCSGLMLLAAVLFVPCAWIVLVPGDPMLRPDITNFPAQIILALCAVFVVLGSRMGRKTKLTYATLIHQLSVTARAAAGAQGITLDVIGQAFPSFLISRRHRLLVLAAPTPEFVKFDDISALIVGAGQRRWDDIADPENTIQIVFKDTARSPIIAVAGNGLGRSTIDETRFIADRLGEYIAPPASWRPEVQDGLRPETLDYIQNLRLI